MQAVTDTSNSPVPSSFSIDDRVNGLVASATSTDLRLQSTPQSPDDSQRAAAAASGGGVLRVKSGTCLSTGN